MIFENLIKENKAAFLKKVEDIARYLDVDPNHLMFLMWFETGHTLNHRIQNRIGATGLIQFMPKTAVWMGTTTDKLKNMSNVEQMDYVMKYLKKWKGKYTSWIDLYCAIFWPAAIGQPDTFRITSDMVVKQNPLFDINKDGDIEKKEIKTALFKQVPHEYQYLFTI